jgi:hypothetical protein
VDDEVLNALLSVPAPPPRLAGPGGEAGAGKVVPFQRPTAAGATDHGRQAASGKVSLLRRPLVLAAIAGVLLVGVFATFWLLRSRPPETVAAPPPPPVVLPKLTSEPPVEELAAAKLHLAQGEDLQARRILRAISFGEQGLLSPTECRELAAVEETLARAAWERLPTDLARGLETGDLELLAAAVEAGAGQEAGLGPEIRANLDRAREAVEAYVLVRAAAAEDDPVQVLERYGALLARLAKASDPDDLRGKAALALETRAEALVKEARYAEALARLGPVQRTWPERDGLKERIARYDTYQQNEQAQADLLASLPGVERRKRPWEALQMLNEVEPTPHLAPQFAAARARLEAQLAQLDKAPPQVVLRDGYLLEFARGTVAELSFRVSDDYEVKDVKLMARREGGKFQEMSLETSRSGYYTVEFPVEFHQNGLVELYVVATDLAGHEASLGSPDQPLQLKRKQGFERLIR